ncbi:hypothetical protein H4Q26_016516 [Puccinia striiformis f. sp. tritici PST-130]|nr:hypothetical protein H4Q26_016516 [Puccinia striiformis f. sp. tritici PST-130]
MPNIPRSPNGQFTRQPLNRTPNSRIPPSAPILDLPHVRVQGGGGDSTTPLNPDDLLNQIIDDDEEEEVHTENLDGQEVVDSIRSGQSTPVPESSIPLTAETLRMPLSGVLRQDATEYKLDSLTMKDGDHASNYISSFRALQSRLPGWGDRPLMFHFRKGLPTRVLDLLAQNTEVFDTLSELIEATLKIDTRHHERQKKRSVKTAANLLNPRRTLLKPLPAPPLQLREIHQLRINFETPSEITNITTGSRQEVFEGNFFDDPPVDL